MSSVGEGMVDMGANPTGDHRVVDIKRASANLIDRIEQLQVLGDAKTGGDNKRQAMHLVAEACGLAVQAAIQRDDEHPQGAPV
jgi:hypothetical protein